MDPVTNPFVNVSSMNQSSLYKCVLNENFEFILLPICYGIVFVIGLILNAFALFIFTFRMKEWTCSTIYMFNLSISDTLYVISLPLLIYYYAKENNWPFGDAMCRIIRFLFYNNLYCSILFLSCISIHRFLGICFPMQSLEWLNVRHARICSVLIWIIVVSCQAPILYFSQTYNNNGNVLCYDTTPRGLFPQFLVYSSIICVMLFCLPILTVIICYCLMAKQLMQPSAEGTSSSRIKKKSIRMIVIVLLVFILCFLPFHITRTIYYIFRQLNVECDMLEASNIAYIVTRPLASANSCLDPILYFLSGQNFRKVFVSASKKKNNTLKLSSFNPTFSKV
ncbi:P2Y purinoceptor 2-like [Erpetoichthys calabaricus]|uniref:P2Y purinoceptor 2-like n=1 Tax=Erpetoichthys calabaricus TaxID=27687 RepID=UPI00223456D2|nr:P2Y purinoceptor 2-like [Erpetoichthys calabaricus]